MTNFKIKKEMITAYLLVLPCVILLILMMVYPIIQVFKFSVSEIKLPSFESSYVGLTNFKKIFMSNEFYTVILNTVIWTVVSLFLRFVIGFTAALIMETGLIGVGAFRILTLIPWMIPSIVTANMWRWIFNTDNGLLNGMLRIINPNLTQNWLGTAQTALPSVIVAYTWAGFPFIMLMLIAGMQSIPTDYYEAARIDGAGAYDLFRHITLPSLKNVIAILIVMELISGFNSFDLIYTMTGGGPGIASEIYGLFIYRIALSNVDFSTASAASVILILIAIIFIVLYVVLSNRKKMEGEHQ